MGSRAGLPHATLVGVLAAAGCVAPDEEAEELEAAAAGDPTVLRALTDRRCGGEPLAWVTGSTSFAGRRLLVHPGVYVPRAQSEILSLRAARLVPARGTVVDLCTGCGAVAAAVAWRRPLARIVATDLDPRACACAAANGVEVHRGHLAEPLPGDLAGHVDVVTAVVPYVPTDAMDYLPRDVRDHEPRLALDGGPDGTVVLRAAVRAAARLLRLGGTLLLELGGTEDRALAGDLDAAGFGPCRLHEDEDGDLRAIEARLHALRSRSPTR